MELRIDSTRSCRWLIFEEGERCSSPNEAATRTLRKLSGPSNQFPTSSKKAREKMPAPERKSRASGTGQNHLGLVGRERLLHLHGKGREIILASCRATCRDSQRSNILIPRTSLS